MSKTIHIVKHLYKEKITYIVLLAVLISSIGIPWGILNHSYFHPDERQHVSIAMNFIGQFDNLMIRKDRITNQWNARGMGTYMAVISYPIMKNHLDPKALFIFGRLISLAFGALTVFLLFKYSFYLFHNQTISYYAALFFALFDLRATNSHYATPDMAQTFFLYLSLFSISMLYEAIIQKVHNNKILFYLLVSAYSAASSLSFKFDVVPLLLLFIIMIYIFISLPEKRKKVSLYFLITILMISGTVYISTGFNYGISEWIKSLAELKSDNLLVIANNNHWLHNPIQYFFAILTGTNIFVILLSLVALIKYKAIKKIKYLLNRHQYLILVLGITLEFIILWSGTATFVRRALIFLPIFAMLAGLGLYKITNQNHKLKKFYKNLIIIFIFTYSFLYTLTYQINFIRETRFQLEKYIIENYTNNPTKIAYDPDVMLENMPWNTDFSDAEYVVLHESYSYRYWKYFTTPFKIPKCCSEVYHCNKQDCEFIQNVFSNPNQYKLIKSFPTLQIFPERLLFHKLFGNYDNFIGDIFIYQKIHE